jgi:hypothetical protein
MTPRWTWESLRAFALSLGLPHVEDAISWGNPNLKAHGKMWVWWSPTEQAPVFKVAFEEREFLCEVEPETFFFTAHYKPHGLLLVRPERLEEDWARDRLLRTWREMAPKKVLKAWDEANGG